MSEFFNDKEYGDYFAELEKQLIKTESTQHTQHTQPVRKNQKPRVQLAKKRSQKRKALSLKRVLMFVIVPVLLIVSIILITNLARNTDGKNIKNKTDKTANSSIKIEDKKTTQKSVDYFPIFDENVQTIGSDIESENIIMINRDTKKVVAARNARERSYPASTTKIMTLLVAVENITDFDDTFTMTYEITDPLYIADATVAGFSSGEVINMTDLLYGVILPSGGDASIALAQKISGSEEAFVRLMNDKAKQLGLKNTHFTNCTGLHDSNHYTTAEDLAVILSAAMDNELCKKILSTYQYTTAKTPQHQDGILLSSTLFSYMYGTEPEGADILGGKTGFVNESGYCIASFGESETDGTEYICVTLSGRGRWPTFYDQIDLYSAYAK